MLSLVRDPNPIGRCDSPAGLRASYVRSMPGPEPLDREARGGADRILLAVAVCFVASGAGGLVLEVAWTRMLRLAFGSTTLAISTVLVAYMLGLGLGGLAAGRLAGRVRNGVRAYGWVEICVGVYALFAPALLGWIPEIGAARLHGLDFGTASLVRFALALALLLVPTFCMGATLPLLVRAIVCEKDGRAGRRIGLLYGLNTFGAVAGVLLTSYALFPLLGLRGASYFGAGLELAVGALALVFIAPRVAAAPWASRRWPTRSRGAARCRWCWARRSTRSPACSRPSCWASRWEALRSAPGSSAFAIRFWCMRWASRCWACSRCSRSFCFRVCQRSSPSGYRPSARRWDG
jgi:hypothetical protein